MVNINPLKAAWWLPAIRAWWDHVTLMPELKRTIVLSRGTPVGSKVWIPKGGQVLPISTDGAKLLWKKAQKKDLKNKISETINKSIPYRSPSSTIKEWRPWKAPSEEMSRHHWAITRRIIVSPVIMRDAEFKWNHFTSPEVKKKAPIELIRGQGDSSTKW